MKAPSGYVAPRLIATRYFWHFNPDCVTIPAMLTLRAFDYTDADYQIALDINAI